MAIAVSILSPAASSTVYLPTTFSATTFGSSEKITSVELWRANVGGGSPARVGVVVAGTAAVDNWEFPLPVDYLPTNAAKEFWARAFRSTGTYVDSAHRTVTVRGYPIATSAKDSLGIAKNGALSLTPPIESRLSRSTPAKHVLRYLNTDSTSTWLSNTNYNCGQIQPSGRRMILSVPVCTGTKTGVGGPPSTRWNYQYTLAQAAAGYLDGLMESIGTTIKNYYGATAFDKVAIRLGWEPEFFQPWGVTVVLVNGADPVMDLTRRAQYQQAYTRQVRALMGPFDRAGLPRPAVHACPAATGKPTVAERMSPFPVGSFSHVTPDCFTRYEGRSIPWAKDRFLGFASWAASNHKLFGVDETAVNIGLSESSGDEAGWWTMLGEVATSSQVASRLSHITAFCNDGASGGGLFDNSIVGHFPLAYPDMKATFGN